MSTLRRILVGVKDPERGVTPAMQKAAQLARATGAELELFHVITTPIYLDAYVDGGRTVEATQRDGIREGTARLQALIASLNTRGRQRPLRVSVKVAWDYPAYEALVRRAHAWGADLVVADRHAGRNLLAALMHFADWELVRQCAAPVLLVRSARKYSHPTLLAAVDPAHLWSKPASLDTHILDMATTLRTALRGHLHAVHARQTAALDSYSTGNPEPQRFEEINQRLSARAARRFAATLTGRRIGKRQQHLLAGAPVSVIGRVAKAVDADVVVLGAIARTGLKRLLIGSTAEALLNRLNCDILVVKPRGFKTHVVRASAGARIVPALPPTPY